MKDNDNAMLELIAKMKQQKNVSEDLDKFNG